VQIGDAALTDPGRAIFREQRYDFTCGELHTSLALEEGGIRADIGVVSLCSRTQPTVALQETLVRVDHDCDLTLSAGLDAREVLGSWGAVMGGPFDWRSPGELSSCGLAYETELSGTDRYDRALRHLATGPLMTSYAVRATAGQAYVLRQYSSLVPLAMHSQPYMQAARLAYAARLRGLDGLRADNRAAWAQLWRARLVLAGAPKRWQALADAAYFYLQTSVHGAAPSATSVFGLAYWPTYH
jgi:hypothetical protein